MLNIFTHEFLAVFETRTTLRPCQRIACTSIESAFSCSFFLFRFFSSFSFFLSFFPFSFVFEEQRALRERAPSSELRLEGQGVKRTRETVVPFAKLKKKFQSRKLENVSLQNIHVGEMRKNELLQY
jgi:hypothetical protein